MSCFKLCHGIFLVISLWSQFALPQTIDEIIAGSYESVDEFDKLADMSGSVIRQELDMMLTREQARDLELLTDGPGLKRKKRKAIRSSTYRWTNNVVPYTIARDVFSSTERAEINAAIEEWEKYTCLNFRPANSRDSNKIYFDNGNGCYSYVGMTRRGSQKIGLAKGCRFKGVVVHEMGHAIGFHHEQNRPDRDNHVRIVRENIPEKLYYNFQKYPTSAVDTMGVPYDYGSVMHYGGRAFTKNGQFTIRTLDPEDQKKIGNRKGLSYYDIMLANKMYSCNKDCDQSTQCPNGAFLGKDCKCWCPGYPVKECESTGTLPTTTNSPDQTTAAVTCNDRNRNCGGWADAGYCSRNTYVKTYCKRSCGFCSAAKPTTMAPLCKDSNKWCPYWGKRNFCTGDFEVFMTENCPKTCNICRDVSDNPGDNSASIVDCSLLLAMVSYSLSILIKSVF